MTLPILPETFLALKRRDDEILFLFETAAKSHLDRCNPSASQRRNCSEFPTVAYICRYVGAVASVVLGRLRVSRRRPIEAQPTVGGRTSRRVYRIGIKRASAGRGRGVPPFFHTISPFGKEGKKKEIPRSPWKFPPRPVYARPSLSSNWRTSGEKSALRKMRDSYRCSRGWHWWSVSQNFPNDSWFYRKRWRELKRVSKSSLFRLLDVRIARRVGRDDIARDAGRSCLVVVQESDKCQGRSLIILYWIFYDRNLI